MIDHYLAQRGHHRLTLDVLPQGARCLAFIQTGISRDSEKLMQRLPESLHPLLIRDAQGEVAGILLQCDEAGANLVETVGQALRQPLERQLPEPASSGPDLMRLRGGLGMAGQGFIIAAGMRSRNSKKHVAAGTSMAANLLNTVYGVQKKYDDVRLGIVNSRIDQAVIDVTAHPLLHQESSLPTEGGVQAFMQANATRLSDGMRLCGKVLFALAGLEGGNIGDLRHGQLSILAKVISITGKDEDPYSTNKSVLTQAREHSNTLSGALEFIGSLPLYTAGLAMQHPNEKMMSFGASLADVKAAGKLQMTGALLILAGMIAKSAAPFTSQTINREAVYQHAAMALQEVPTEARADVLAQLTGIAKEVLDEEVTKRKLPAKDVASFGEIYLNVLAHLPQVERPLPTIQAAEYAGRQQMPAELALPA